MGLRHGLGPDHDACAGTALHGDALRQGWDNPSATSRAATSVSPPAAKGQMRRTGWLGQADAASAGAARAATADS